MDAQSFRKLGTDDELDPIRANLLSDSEDESDAHCGGSRPGRCANIECGRVRHALQLYKELFSQNPTFLEHLFEHRYKVSKQIFFKLRNLCVPADSLLPNHRPVRKKRLLMPRKVMADMCQLA